VLISSPLLNQLDSRDQAKALEFANAIEAGILVSPDGDRVALHEATFRGAISRLSTDSYADRACEALRALPGGSSTLSTTRTLKVGGPETSGTPSASSVKGAHDIITTIAAAAGLEDEDVTAHILRHTFATRLVRGRTDLVIVAELLGHARLETARAYSRPTQQDAIDALQLLDVDH
jgi:integrase